MLVLAFLSWNLSDRQVLLLLSMVLVLVLKSSSLAGGLVLLVLDIWDLTKQNSMFTLITDIFGNVYPESNLASCQPVNGDKYNTTYICV